ncbi:hypothetical protein EHO61_12845 [Leptospira fluminis]|uniref:Glycosyl transferase n=1 Tax=Leptospira fluminis TaxID=2484979 RepID=A0A4R9GN76_9LEPT|nr:hypothetical protein [Leptospira fluminis]TGK17291.1 hypothetical protein EHO61_12845 [Leptospira fluminis]
MSEAIDWFFGNESEGIILEDDCLPSEDFFRFCETALERFRNESKVMHVSGTNFVPSEILSDADAYFTRYPHVWGWATWRRAWREYLREDKIWNKEGISAWKGSSARVREFWNEIFERTYSGRIDTWDFQWVYTLNQRGGLAINSSRNLVQNVGFGEDATHTKSRDDQRAEMRTEKLADSFRFPNELKMHKGAVGWLEKHHYSRNGLPSRIFSFLKRRILSVGK